MIVPPAARKKAERLLGWAKLRAEWADAPSAEDVSARDDVRMLSDPEWTAEIEPSIRVTVDKLVANFSTEQLAAAYVRLYREKHTAPEELSDLSEPAKPRAPFGPSVWFSLEGGHAANAEPRRLLPMICKMGNVSREDIGAIRIQPEASLIEIRESAVKTFTDAVGPKMTLEGGAKITRVSGAPKFDKGPRRDGPPPKPRKPRHEDKPKGTTTPVEWNDDPTPRPKKPKGGKPKPKYEKKPEAPKADAWKPRKSSAPKSDDKPAHSKAGKPPAGKPSSKKNRARQVAAKDGASTRVHRMQKPTKGKPKPGKGKPQT
jgi:ATP-dependent RNA helicase DeaD